MSDSKPLRSGELLVLAIITGLTSLAKWEAKVQAEKAKKPKPKKITARKPKKAAV